MASALVATGPVLAAVTAQNGPTTGGTEVARDFSFIALDTLSPGYSNMTGRGTDGGWYAWGSNLRGQLGIGSVDARTHATPERVLVPEGVTFESVESKYSTSMGIATDGAYYAWGSNSYGSLGVGETDPEVPAPARVMTPPGISYRSIDYGPDFGVGLGSDGNAYTWGKNNDGQLGVGSDLADSPTPVRVAMPEGVTFTEVHAGSGRVVAVGSNGAIYSWGYNLYNAQGTDGPYRQYTPARVATPEGVTFTTIEMSVSHDTFARGSDGNWYAWGDNRVAQLGDGTTEQRTAPVVVTNMPEGVTYTSIMSGALYTIATGSDGNTYSWGSNVYGILGAGDFDARVTATPVRVLTPDGVVFNKIEAQGTYAVAWGTDGNVYAWGNNSYDGQFGIGSSAVNWAAPIPVPQVRTTVTGVSFGGVSATNVGYDGSRWSATTPPNVCGPVDIVISYTALGVSNSVTIENGFTYGALPVVSRNPVDLEVEDASTAVTMTAEATGDTEPTVQWQRSVSPDGPWSDVVDATSVELSTYVDQDTYFRAVFTNCLATVTSDPALVTLQGTDPTPPLEPTGAASTTPVPGAATTTPTLGTAAHGTTDARLPWTGAAIATILVAAFVTCAVGIAVLLVRRRRTQ